MNVLFLLPLFILAIGIPSAFAANVIYSNPYPVWYSYDCSDPSPNTWTVADPTVNLWKYFGFYDGTCYATLHTFDFSDLDNIENVTSINYYSDSQSMVLTNRTADSDYQANCMLYYFPNTSGGSNLSLEPTLINSMDCTSTDGTVQQIIIPFSAGQNTTLTAALQAGNFSQSFMIFPNFTSTLRSSLDADNNNLAIGKFRNSIEFTGDGFDCAVIAASGWCNILYDPWGAIKHVLGYDYIGDWFYVIVFFPIPIMVFLVSRNGLYAGFACLPILLFIETINDVVIQISLSLIAMAGAFGFYELMRKKLVE